MGCGRNFGAIQELPGVQSFTGVDIMEKVLDYAQYVCHSKFVIEFELEVISRFPQPFHLSIKDSKFNFNHQVVADR